MFQMQDFYIYLGISENCLIPLLQYLSYEGNWCYPLRYFALSTAIIPKDNILNRLEYTHSHYRRSDESPLITMGPIKQLRNAKQEHYSLNSLPFDEGFPCKNSNNPTLIQSPMSNASSPGTSRKSFRDKVNSSSRYIWISNMISSNFF